MDAEHHPTCNISASWLPDKARARAEPAIRLKFSPGRVQHFAGVLVGDLALLKLKSVIHASNLLLIMNFVMTCIVKVAVDPRGDKLTSICFLR